MGFSAIYKITRLAFFAAALLFSAGVTALADSYSIVPIGSTETFVIPKAINNAGQIVGGLAQRPQQPGVLPVYRPFLYSNGVFRVLSDLGSTGEQFSTAAGINNLGDAVGSVPTDGFGQPRAFLYRNDRFRDLGTFGEDYSFANDINDAGQIVGGTNSRDSGQRAFLLDGDKVQFIDVPPINGYAPAEAIAINNAGQIAVEGFGIAYLYDSNSGILRNMGTLGSRAHVLDLNDAGQAVGYSALTPWDVDEEDEIVHAFIYENGVMRDIDTWGSVYSQAAAINNLGQVVGGALLPDGSEAYFLYSDGEMRDLESLLAPDANWEILYATDINDRGQIIGQGYFEGEYLSFLMTPDDVEPVPEPATMVLLGTGLARIGAAVRKRRRADKGEEL